MNVGTGRTLRWTGLYFFLVDRGEDLDGVLALVVYILPCEIARSVHGVLTTLETSDPVALIYEQKKES